MACDIVAMFFAYYGSDVVEASFKGLGHVGDMGEEEETGAKEGSPEQKTFEGSGKNKPKETAQKSTPALDGHGHARSGLDEFFVPQETHADVYSLKRLLGKWIAQLWSFW